MRGRSKARRGRLVYVGTRWVYYTGSSERRTDSDGTYDVLTGAQVIAADLGLEFPAGALEVVAGATIGAARFRQRTSLVSGPGSTAPLREGGTELLVAPNLSVQFHTTRLLVIPEVMYLIAGSPDVRWPVAHRGISVGLRVIVPFEVRRIRH